MKKQYIKSTNSAPTMALSTPWLLAISTKVYGWPSWVYGIAGTLVFVLTLSCFVRIITEEGVDVVKR